MMRSVVHLRLFPSPTRALRRGLVLLLALVTLLFGALVAPSASHAGPHSYGYILWPADEGDPQHLPILIYRQRHTSLTQNGGNPDEFVSWARNVAEFEWAEQRGDTQVNWVIVTANVSGFAQNSKVALIDLYQRDPSGQLRLVDPAGNPLLEADGKTPVDWRTSSTPSYRWDMRTDPDLRADLRSGRMHSERVAKWFLQKHMSGAHDKVPTGLSEKIPCDVSPSRCQQNMKSSWFPEMKTMKFMTDLESRAKLKREGTPEAKDKLNSGEDSDSFLQKGFEKWKSLGMPAGPDAAAVMGGRLFQPPGSPAPKGAGATALNQGADPGGIDFSTLELRYLSEDGSGQLRYALDAAPAKGNDAGDDRRVTDGKIAAAQMSDAFFVWLSLSPSTFWVNLNPTEPNRIVDAKLGATDVGRILLEADFRMKKVVGRLLHPDTGTGKKFWDSSDVAARRCINMRQWIVPKPASVYEENGGLYIVDAPLEVKMETEYLKQHGGGGGSCAVPDKRLESAFRTVILPRVENAVNEAPEFAELRRVYLSRVAAEWYRQRSSGALASMVDSGDVSRWPALKQWSPRKVFNDYVESYNKKEFNVKRLKTINGKTYEVTYTHGGVDFGKVTLDKMDSSVFRRHHADLPTAVQDSFQNVTRDRDGRVVLGLSGRPKAHAINYSGGNEPEDYADGIVPESRQSASQGAGSGFLIWAVGAGLLAAAAVIFWVYTHRQRTARPLPPSREPSVEDYL
ncbi:hypothetical protein ACIRPT_35295 [Streptomyces sp. NPDC101227]|uniref:hypothetical protein n=1 Tax=Streptomyces sp. NPDC101227 TaxID=3366136 RepID=UPI003824406E